MTRYSEVERKFDVDPSAPLPDLSGAAAAVSEGVESQLDATYFDTADTRLVRQRITLRRRTGGDDPAGTSNCRPGRTSAPRSASHWAVRPARCRAPWPARSVRSSATAR